MATTVARSKDNMGLIIGAGILGAALLYFLLNKTGTTSPPGPGQTPPPAAPTLTKLTSNQVGLAWAWPAVAGLVISIERKMGSGAWFEYALANQPQTNWLDYSVNPEITASYEYRSRFKTAGGVFSAYSNSLVFNVTGTRPPVAAPVPTLTADAWASNQVNLFVSFQNLAGVSEVHIERSVGGLFTTLAVLDKVGEEGVFTFRDFNVAPNTTYQYRARSRTLDNTWSGYSTVVSVRTP